MPASFTADEILYATSSHLKSGQIDDQKGRIRKAAKASLIAYRKSL